MASAVDLAWTGLVAVLTALVILGLIVLRWLAREPRRRSVRFGFFVERDTDKDNDEKGTPDE